MGESTFWRMEAERHAKPMGVYNSAELGELSQLLSVIEDWLRQDCTARHAEDMADVIRRAWRVVDDLADEQRELEESAAADSSGPY